MKRIYGPVQTTSDEPVLAGTFSGGTANIIRIYNGGEAPLYFSLNDCKSWYFMAGRAIYQLHGVNHKDASVYIRREGGGANVTNCYVEISDGPIRSPQEWIALGCYRQHSDDVLTATGTTVYTYQAPHSGVKAVKIQIVSGNGLLVRHDIGEGDPNAGSLRVTQSEWLLFDEMKPVIKVKSVDGTTTTFVLIWAS